MSWKNHFDDNNYLEYTKYKLSNSTIPVIKGGQDPEVIYNSSIENYSEFIDYISNISYLHTPSYRDNTYININNTMSFKYNFAKPQTYTFILRFENFNQFMYNTTEIQNLRNNFKSKQKYINIVTNNIAFLKDTSNIFLEKYTILKDNITNHQEDIKYLKDNSSTHTKKILYYFKKIIVIYLLEETLLF